jgi:tetratricopeptide (TPR) repeat protein
VNAGGFRYWAFISYSHRDAKVAAALQRALETYRIPRRLVGRSTPLGEVPEYLKPVFRDREELQAGADLNATVREALAQSRYLIVLCSPEAARSEWVNREIIEFKKAHGEARVLALITAGEPFASRIAGREGEECFPVALRFALTPEGEPGGEPLEPVAADLRPHGDGRRLATLKLVAGMVGIGVDELVRRDAQRRIRRLAMVAAASVAGMAVMAVLAIVAVRARVEAERQHAKAEDLLEFMLGDLRRKLDPVGRLDALDSVGEKALAYYAGQDADRLDADSLGRRSRALHLIGEIREQRGKLDEALAAFTSAEATTAQALARAPGDGQRIFDHAQSVYWVGYAAWRRGEAQAAQDAFLKYRDLAHRLVAVDPSNADWKLEIGYASQNVGVVQLERGRLEDALKSFTEARDAYAGLAAAKPAVAFELADAHGWIAKVREASGNYAGAIEAQQARLDVLRAMPDAAKDTRIRRNGANAYHDLARLRLYLGDATGAEGDARAAVEQAESLVAADATNLFWLAEACFNRMRLAEAELALDKRGEARRLAERASADVSRLLASDASNLHWQVNLEGLVLALKARLAVAERRAAPGEAMEGYLAKVRGLEASGKKLSGLQSEIVATVAFLSGDFLYGSGRREAARIRWWEAAERLRPREATDEFPVLTLLARIRLRLGDLAEARALAARVEASKFRHPAYAGLVNELAQAAGAGHPDNPSRRN